MTYSPATQGNLRKPYSQKRLDEAKAAFAALPYDDALIFLLGVLEDGEGLCEQHYDLLVDADPVIAAIASSLEAEAV